MKTVIKSVAVMVFTSAVGLNQSAFAEEKLMPESVHLSATTMNEILKKKGSDEGGDYVSVPFQDRMGFETTRLVGGMGRDYFSFSLYRQNFGRVQTSVDSVVDSYYPVSSTGRSNLPNYVIGFALTSHIRSRGEISSSQ